jgi:thiamine-phosphate pyrophosphorylase
MSSSDFLYYLITDPKYYSNNSNDFGKILTKVLKNKKIDIACFRDKESNNRNELASAFIDICKKLNISKVLINSDISLCLELEADGVHLNSKQFDKIECAKSLGLYVIISCHTHDEIKKAIELGADALTYSPIFSTPNKGVPKGLKDLKDSAIKFKEIDIYALGGIINESQIEHVKQTGVKGFASIRYFTT